MTYFLPGWHVNICSWYRFRISWYLDNLYTNNDRGLVERNLLSIPTETIFLETILCRSNVSKEILSTTYAIYLYMRAFWDILCVCPVMYTWFHKQKSYFGCHSYYTKFPCEQQYFVENSRFRVCKRVPLPFHMEAYFRVSIGISSVGHAKPSCEKSDETIFLSQLSQPGYKSFGSCDSLIGVIHNASRCTFCCTELCLQNVANHFYMFGQYQKFLNS